MLGTKSADTYFASAMGFGTIGVSQRATAVAGYLQSVCAGDSIDGCPLLPVTIPVNKIICDGNNRPIDSGEAWARYVVHKVPLCGNAPGNVGWLDWFPPAGGASELGCSIENPNNPPFDLPSWQHVNQTGNVNGGGGNCDGEGLDSVEDEIREYNGQIVYIPQFDVTVGRPITPRRTTRRWRSQTSTDALKMISMAETATTSGIGSRALPTSSCARPPSPNAAGLQGAYIQGNNTRDCESGGNGATWCLVGKFVDILCTGPSAPVSEVDWLDQGTWVSS